MPIRKLIEGYRHFRAETFPTKRDRLQQLVAEGQHPEVCMIACSDSRVSPATVMEVEPGQIFSIRNVANLVPPYNEHDKYHETGAALEYAVQVLKVRHIIVLGHAHCGGIQALMGGAPTTGVNPGFITPWVALVETAKRRVMATLHDADEPTRQRACEQNAVLVSLENLMTYPCIQSKVGKGEIKLHGWYIDIATAELQGFNARTNLFEPVDVAETLDIAPAS